MSKLFLMALLLPLFYQTESSLLTMKPVVVTATKPRLGSWSKNRTRAEGVERVSLTNYCLKGTTRRGNKVRHGIVAADPKVFPLGSTVDVFLGMRYLGRYLVDDTGGNVKGRTLDIWEPSCRNARRFGRQWGRAVLVNGGSG